MHSRTRWQYFPALFACSLLRLCLGSSYDLSGTVVKADGEPAAGATVYQYRQSYGQPDESGVRAKVTTGPDGAFELKGLMFDRAKRVYDRVLAVAEGWGFAWCSASSKPPVVLKLAEEAIVAGVLVDGSGKPVVGAPVAVSYVRVRNDPSSTWSSTSLNPNDPFPALSSHTDAQGRFRIGHLPRAKDGYVRIRVKHGHFAIAQETVQFRDAGKELKIALGPGATIKGRVRYEGTGAPASGVGVEVYGRVARRSIRDRVTTDKDGRYSVGNLPAADYRVSISFESDAEWTSPPKSGVSVAAGQTVGSVDLTLIEGELIRGRVVEAGTDKPVPGVYVYASGANMTPRSATGRDGSFTLRCPPGSYSVRVSTAPKGYVRPDFREHRSVTVKDGQQTQGLVFRLTKGVTVAGRVVDPKGQPVAKARVTSRAGIGGFSAAITDDQGQFSLLGIAPHTEPTITVRAAKEKLGAIVHVDVADASPPSTPIELSPMGTIAGRVVDKNGEPVPGHRVRLHVHGERVIWPGQNTTTRDDGRYQFDVVPGLRVSVRGDSGPRHGPRSPDTVVVVTGKRHEMVDLTVQPHVKTTISGRVLRPDGNPAPNVRVTMRIEWETTQVNTNKQGEFVLKDVQTKGRPVKLTATDTDTDLAGQTSVTPTKAKTEATVQLVKAASVAGRVVGEAGEPIAGAQVDIYVQVNERSYSSARKARTGADGSYRVAGLVPHSKGHVHVSAPGHGSRSSKRRQFESGKTLAIEDLVLLKADSFVGGKVTDIDGKPLAGVRVACYGSGMDYRHSSTDSQGRYRIEGIPKVDDLHISVERHGYRRDRRSRAKAGASNVDFNMIPERRVRPKALAVVGKPAPEPALASWLNTPPLALAALRGKAVLIHFWTRYSRASVRSIESLKALQAKHADRLTILAIHDRATSVDEVREFAKEKGLSFPIGFVKSTKEDGWAGQTFQAYGVKALPATFLVDKKGELRHANVAEGLGAKVQALVAE